MFLSMKERARNLPISRGAELRTLALVAAAALVPVGGTVAVIAVSSRPDLAELVPVEQTVNGDPLLNWSDLLRPNPQSAGLEGKTVRALGYMMADDRGLSEGQWVKAFILLPEAGNPLHPAHRFADQMIAVHLRDDAPVRFSARSLVWAWGSMGAVAGDPEGDTPLWSLERAQAQPAGDGAIGRYFR